MGKVLEFKPRKKRKLKSVNFVDPAKKELYKKRKKQKDLLNNRNKIIKNIAYFIMICIIVYVVSKVV